MNVRPPKAYLVGKLPIHLYPTLWFYASLLMFFFPPSPFRLLSPYWLFSFLPLLFRSQAIWMEVRKNTEDTAPPSNISLLFSSRWLCQKLSTQPNVEMSRVGMRSHRPFWAKAGMKWLMVLAPARRENPDWSSPLIIRRAAGYYEQDSWVDLLRRPIWETLEGLLKGSW